MSALLDSPSPRARQRLARLPVWFEAWEESLSRFRAGSELNRVNASPGRPVQVSATFAAVFQAARQAYLESDGLVTPAVLDALVSAGYDRTYTALDREIAAGETAFGPACLAAIPVDQAIAEISSEEPSATRVPALEVIGWDPATRTICLPPGVRLDFGGVAKGWAAHQAAQWLRPYGAALVDAGGDIAISGVQADGRPWPVGIADPFHPELDLETVRLGRCGVATSGRDFRRWKSGRTWKHHLIDPRTGEPADTDVLSVTVIAPDLIQAEMAAKVVLLSGSRLGMAWLENHPAFAGLAVLERGDRLYSRKFDQFKWG
jgi:thiamine biosynthesis lipoprotein